MGDTLNYAALDWVIGEIGDTLNDARQSLEAYVEDPKDSSRIRFCLNYIHQVHGSLKLVEFQGAAVFAEEMELLAEAIRTKDVANEQEAHEVLMRSLLQLPIYLDQVKAFREDHPGIVLPLLNDVRAARKQPYLSETSLFNPKLAAAKVLRGQKHPYIEDATKLKPAIKKLRDMYQYAAAGVLRGLKVDENLGYLEKALSRLETLARGTQSHALWFAGAALFEALQRDDVELSVAVRGLFRHLARELGVLESHAPQAFDIAPNEGLLRNLLYYIACAEPGGKRVDMVKKMYALDEALLGGTMARAALRQGLISAPDENAIKAVANALQEELNTVKHLLDGVLNGQGGSSDVQEILPVMKRIGDTLAVMGVPDMRDQVMSHHDTIRDFANAGSWTESDLIDVAGKIADVENRLQAIARSAGKARDLSQLDEREVEIDSAKAAVLEECRGGLNQIRDAIMAATATGWDREPINSVVDAFSKIQGGLNMVPLPRSAAIIEACAQYAEDKLLHAADAPHEELTLFAEAIESIDYYLESISAGHVDNIERYLDIAVENLSKLDKPVDAEFAHASTEPANDDLADAESIGTEPDTDIEKTSETSETSAAAALAESEDAAFDMDEAASNAALQMAEAGFIREADASQDSSETGETAVAESSQEEPVTEASNDSADDSDEEDDIDEEILEIFVEEAAEVQETLAESFPRWAANPDDEDALTTTRRSFHTLKGSGRMVKAMDVGELAWSIENMLNRVIDQSIAVDQNVFSIIERVLALVPTLVKAFEDREPNPEKARTELYIGWANQLSKGEVPADFLQEADDTVSPDAPLSKDPAEDVVEDVVEDLVEDETDEEENRVLWEIFASEAQSHLSEVDRYVGDMEAAAPLYEVPTDHLQRALHTLKGSAHMAGVAPIASMMAPLEQFVKDLRSYQVKIDDDILQLIKDAATYTHEGLEAIERKDDIVVPKLDQFTARVRELSDKHITPLVHLRDTAGADGKQPVDPRLLSIFMAEEMRVLLDADDIIAPWQQSEPADPEAITALVSELSTLSEGAEQANLPLMGNLSGQLKTLFEQVQSGERDHDAELYDVVAAAHGYLLDMVDAVAAGQTLIPVSEKLQSQLDTLLAEQQEITAGEEETASEDETLPTMELAYPVDDTQAAETVEGEAVDYADFIQANDYGDVPVSDLFEQADDSESEDADAADEQFEATFEAETELGDGEAIEDDPVFEGEPVLENASVTKEPEFILNSHEAQTAQTGAESEDDAVRQAVPAALSEDHIAYIAPEDFDRDILDIFLEEANELTEELDEAIHDWENNDNNEEARDTMLRALHTVKGGARLSGIKNVGELVHDFETYLIGTKGPEADPDFFKNVHAYQDRFHHGIRSVGAMLSGDAMPEEKTDSVLPTQVEVSDDERHEAIKLAVGEQAADALKREREAQNVIPFAQQRKSEELTESLVGGMPAANTAQAPIQQPTKRQGSQEMVKVSADLLEELVNLAGETSISRGRLEQQVNDLGSALEDVDGTLARLQEQLRRLDAETEAQVLFRQEQMAAHEEFDPLEMDRYSHLQQLSRSLMESASDLFDLRSTLANKVRDTETLLLQQSRVNSSLQEGLMRTRMVPFARLVPRLRRIVRQISGELGKHVNFELDNVEGEMDRSVMERMVAPLEHMLRNAVDHGIESPEARRESGKSETGRILLSLAREGGDILLRLADDGGGINLERVRQKAIENGLMAEDADLPDHDVMQFILHAGFSTAENITQISGRGVGMDVVAAEIKQLGGSIVIDSKQGMGTQFTVRLPFTVSVNRALMVQLGGDTYAIPLNTIEGIVRVSPFELEHYYAHPEARFEYAGEQYQVRHIGAMLSPDILPRLEGQLLPLPVILVRTAQHTMALQVDALMGSREIVVKTLGPQFSAVQGISGATVMGDGSVVIIVDPHALVRRDIAQAALSAPVPTQIEKVEQYEDEDGLKTIMVVDDSVTVRKVTTRFLEREGYNVITAKDGVDALQVLQDATPDLMLLDIEMPRMDGFEVARNVRGTSTLKHIPIIMITSRTGDKHREHALSIGVNDYLGKPYQEDVLLKTMRGLLGEASET